jgi:hypothetical protein
MVTLPNPKIKTLLLNNKKVFIKYQYSPNDIVWWVDSERITGRVTHSEENYCYIEDELHNIYVKPHTELFLEETNIIQSLMNEVTAMEKDIHNLKCNYNALFNKVSSFHDNPSFNIEPPEKILSRL